jgi:hypothetical protein
MPVFKDFQKGEAVGGVEGLEAEVVDYKDIKLSFFDQFFKISSICF